MDDVYSTKEIFFFGAILLELVTLSMESSSEKKPRCSWRSFASDAQLFLLALPYMLGKLMSYTAVRFPYVLIVPLAEAWNITMAEFGVWLACTEFAFLIGAYVAPVGDLLGNEAIATGALVVASGTILLTGLLPSEGGVSFPLLVITRMIFAAAACVFSITAQVTVCYGRTSAEMQRITGVIEFSWSLAGGIGTPLAGLLFGYAGWRATWLVLAGCGLVLVPVVLAVAVNRCVRKRRLAHEAASARHLWELSNAAHGSDAEALAHIRGADDTTLQVIFFKCFRCMTEYFTNLTTFLVNVYI